jgi:hypothetical protein
MSGPHKVAQAPLRGPSTPSGATLDGDSQLYAQPRRDERAVRVLLKAVVAFARQTATWRDSKPSTLGRTTTNECRDEVTSVAHIRSRRPRFGAEHTLGRHSGCLSTLSVEQEADLPSALDAL